MKKVLAALMLCAQVLVYAQVNVPFYGNRKFISNDRADTLEINWDVPGTAVLKSSRPVSIPSLVQQMPSLTGTPNQILYFGSDGKLKGNDSLQYEKGSLILKGNDETNEAIIKLLSNGHIYLQDSADYTNAVITNAKLPTFTGGYNAIFGQYSGHNLKKESTIGTTLIGSYAGLHLKESKWNTALGASSLETLQVGNYNTAVGGGALAYFGYPLVGSYDNCIALGAWSGNHNQILSNRLFINSLNRANIRGDTTLSIIYGLQSTNMNSQKLQVNGKFIANGGTTSDIASFQSNGVQKAFIDKDGNIDIKGQYKINGVAINTGGASLPIQTDNAGNYLTTDGTNASWSSLLATAGDATVGTIKYNGKTQVAGQWDGGGADPINSDIKLNYNGELCARTIRVSNLNTSQTAVFGSNTGSGYGGYFISNSNYGAYLYSGSSYGGFLQSASGIPLRATLTTGNTSKIATFTEGNTEKAYIDYSGKGVFNGGLEASNSKFTVDASGNVNITGGAEYRVNGVAIGSGSSITLATAGDDGVGAVKYNGTIATEGMLYGGNTIPNLYNTTLNFQGLFRAGQIKVYNISNVSIWGETNSGTAIYGYSVNTGNAVYGYCSGSGLAGLFISYSGVSLTANKKSANSNIAEFQLNSNNKAYIDYTGQGVFNGGVYHGSTNTDSILTTKRYVDSKLAGSATPLVTAGDAVVGAVKYNGGTKVAGQFYSSITPPSTVTNRLNYDGIFDATLIRGYYKQVGSGAIEGINSSGYGGKFIGGNSTNQYSAGIYVQSSSGKGLVVDNFVDNTSDLAQFNINSATKAYINYTGMGVFNGGIETSGLINTTGDKIRIATKKTPSSATDTGTTGDICWDENYIYICVAPNTWKRSPISNW